MSLATMFADEESKTQTGPIRVIVAGFPPVAQPFAALTPGNERGVEVLATARDTLDLLPDVKEYKPQVVLISPEIRNYYIDIVQELANWPEAPIAVIGLVPATGTWGSEMATAGATAFYNLPITQSIVDKFVSEAPTLVDKAVSAWRAPAVATGVSRTLLDATGATAYKTGVVTFWSTKGGAGKTTLATETACILSQVGGKRVLLVDANMNGGHVGLHLSIDAHRNNIMHLASDYRVNNNRLTVEMLQQRTVQADTFVDKRTHTAKSRLHVLLGIPNIQHAGSKELAGEQGESFIKDLLSLGREQYEFVVVDLGSSIMNGVHIGVLSSADVVMFLSSADRTSIFDNRNVFELLMEKRSLRPEKFRLVINDYSPEGGIELEDIARYMKMHVYACVPHDSTHSVLRSINEGQPFSLGHMDIRKNAQEVEATLRGIFAISEGVFPPLGAIIQAREEKLDGKKRRGLFKR